MFGRHQLAHRDAPTNLESGLGVRRARKDLLEHGAARRDGLEALVSVARGPIYDAGRHQTQRIEPQGAGRHERSQHVREFLLEHNPATRL